jgi:2-polyprenyl-3-methyl-5-hydroxy-6-metoxy-1,4-benzoquinol methylase
MYLSCPHCTLNLQEKNEQLHCTSCDQIWDIRSGIPRFVDDIYYWGELPLTLMQEVNACAQEHDWRTALDTLVKYQYPNIYEYVTDASRADFTYLIPLEKESVILDVGSGWGTISYLLALRHEHIVSIESVAERIAFQQIRAKQENIANIELVQASFLQMPVTQGGFDLAILNGVLEWIGIASEAKPPYELQLDVLRKLWASLKPGGYLYIGIENRLAYGYFLGGLDHSGLPFTSLMPRSLANVVMRRTAKRDWRTHKGTDAYRTYTYSYWGYKRLLKQAGFSNVKVNLVFPDYNHPAYIISAEDKAVFQYVVRQLYSGQSTRRKLLRNAAIIAASLGLHRFLSPCFSIFAQKL